MKSPYSTRYQIVERGRRLVTIDMETGAEIGQAANVPMDLAASDSLKVSGQVQKPLGQLSSIEAPQTSTQNMGLPRPNNTVETSNRMGRMMIVGFAGICIVAVIILLQLYFIIGAFLILPITRPLVLSLSSKIYKRVVAWVNESAA